VPVSLDCDVVAENRANVVEIARLVCYGDQLPVAVSGGNLGDENLLIGAPGSGAQESHRADHRGKSRQPESDASHGLPSQLLPQRLERRSQIGHQEVRLLPGREVPALVVPAVKNKSGIGLHRPAPRSLVQLVGEGADADRNGDSFWRKESELALPVQTSRR